MLTLEPKVHDFPRLDLVKSLETIFFSFQRKHNDLKNLLAITGTNCSQIPTWDEYMKSLENIFLVSQDNTTRNQSTKHVIIGISLHVVSLELNAYR